MNVILPIYTPKEKIHHYYHMKYVYKNYKLANI